MGALLVHRAATRATRPDSTIDGAGRATAVATLAVGRTMPVTSPMIVSVEPLPPRCARVHYVGASVGRPVDLVVTTGGVRLARIPTRPDSGTATLTCLHPGMTFEVALAGAAGVIPGTRHSLAMPRAITSSIAVTPGENSVVVRVWLAEKTHLRIELVQDGSPGEAARTQVEPNPITSLVRRLTDLRPSQNYSLNLSTTDAGKFIPWNSLQFRTCALGQRHEEGVQIGRIEHWNEQGMEGIISGNALAEPADWLDEHADADAADGLLKLLGGDEEARIEKLENRLERALVRTGDARALDTLIRRLDRLGPIRNANPRRAENLLDCVAGFPDESTFAKVWPRVRELPPNSPVVPDAAQTLVRVDPSGAAKRWAEISDAPAKHTTTECTLAAHGLSFQGDSASLKRLVRLMSTAVSPLDTDDRPASVLEALGDAVRVSTDPPGWSSIEPLLGGRFVGRCRIGVRRAPEDLASIGSLVGSLGRLDDPRAGQFLRGLDAVGMEPRIRQRAIEGWAHLEGRVADQALIAELDDPSPSVARAVAGVLARNRALSAVPALISKLQRHDISLGSFPRALGLIGDPRAIEPLLGAARSGLDGIPAGPDAPPELVADTGDALFALGLLGATAARETLLGALKNAHWYIRLRALEGLALLGDPSSLPSIRESGIRATGSSPEVVAYDLATVGLHGFTGPGLRARPIVVDPAVSWLPIDLDTDAGDGLVLAVSGVICPLKAIARGFDRSAVWTHVSLYGTGPVGRLAHEVGLSTGESERLTFPGPIFVGSRVHRPPFDQATLAGFLCVWIEHRPSRATP